MKSMNSVFDILLMVIINIICSFISIFIISIVRNEFCKIKIIDDEVCGSKFYSIGEAIDYFNSIKNELPLVDWKNFSPDYYKFYMNHAYEIKIRCLDKLSEDNLIILSSIRQTFLIGLNFKLINLLNKV